MKENFVLNLNPEDVHRGCQSKTQNLLWAVSSTANIIIFSPDHQTGLYV